MLKNANQFLTKFIKCYKLTNKFSQNTQNVKNIQVHKDKL